MRAPASPMKSFAGLQFSGRNPTHAPISTAAMKDASEKLFVAKSRSEQVRVGEEHAVRDEAHPGDQPVEPVDEVDGVHHDHDREHRENEAHPARADRQAADRQREICSSPTQAMMPAARNCAPSLIVQSRSQRSSATPTRTMSSVAREDRAGSAAGRPRRSRRTSILRRHRGRPRRRRGTSRCRRDAGSGVLCTSRSRMPG